MGKFCFGLCCFLKKTDLSNVRGEQESEVLASLGTSDHGKSLIQYLLPFQDYGSCFWVFSFTDRDVPLIC